MIHVSQGHEKSISLEVFLKSVLCFSQNIIHNFKLHCFEDTLKDTLKSCMMDFSITNNSLIVNNKILSLELLKMNTGETQTTNSLNSCLKACSQDDILLTLPSSKDQFVIKNAKFNGHTEFFRHIYANHDLSMLFIGHKMNLLLLSDHIAISEVSNYLTLDLIKSKSVKTINYLLKFRKLENIYFSGINPHAGENGLLGTEDSFIHEAIKSLKGVFPEINFKGPLPADTIYFENFSNNDLFIFSNHDQGLTLFKSMYGLSGINTTVGLPFMRVSPDHGTAFHLYGKNSANYSGMFYLINEISKW
jgi:4-hydroxythreonine-4-phosphate dehydrogenase